MSDWDRYFINIAKQVAYKSKDPSTKVGCVVTSTDNRPLSFGYNGFVAGIDESKMTFDRPKKYQLIIHAEMNAILFAERSLKDSRFYITHSPCANCLKHILQSGAQSIVYETLFTTFSKEEKEAIISLLEGSKIDCHCVNGTPYVQHLR